MTFEESEDDARVTDLFNHLVDQGALELLSIHPESHEPVYRITPKCEEVLPELYYEFQSSTNKIIFDLWQLGILDVKFSEKNGSDMIRLCSGWHDPYMENKENLTTEHRYLVYNLIDDASLIHELEKLYDEGN